MAPTWVDHAMWWHVYPLGFTGAEPVADDATPVTHRLAQVEAWVDHVVDLGLNGLALGPVFASSTHGYDTVDHLRVDPRLGDRDDLDRLLAAARDRGVRVLLDGVFNHVGEEHPLFRAALAGGPGSPEARLFRIRWPDDGGAPDWDCFEGHRSLVALDHDSPEVVDLVADVMTHWLDAGADGWRLDAAYAVPTGFWAQVVARVRERHPDAYLMGEVIHGDYPAFVAESGLDGVTQYELWKATWSAVRDRNWHELVWTLGRHDAFLDSFVPYTFVGNHDVTRIADQVGDPALAGHALVVLMTVGGTPAVYSGDELAYRGVKEDRAGGDDAVRPAFPPTPADLPGPDEAPDAWAAYHRHQALIGLRRRHPWLHTARTRVVEVTNTRLAYEARPAGATSDGTGPALLVALNLDAGTWSLATPDGARVVAQDGPGTTERDHVVDVAPLGWVVLEV
ncbi:alpha-amylase family protein [Cellulomonas sp. NPDC058312]|uniref:alpha-amylase family protein n=1 Tax=Cellulomonas sp. NPDC058312 TaxID=3346441 RepID=UPI0036EEE70D